MKWKQKSSLGAQFTARTLFIFMGVTGFFTMLFQWLDRYQWMTSVYLITLFGMTSLLVLGVALSINSHLLFLLLCRIFRSKIFWRRKFSLKSNVMPRLSLKNSRTCSS